MTDSERAQKYLMDAEQLLHECVSAYLCASSYLKKLDRFDLDDATRTRQAELRDDFDREIDRMSRRRAYR